MRNIKSFTREERAAALKELGLPAFREKQIYACICRGARSWDECTDLSKDLRAKLSGTFSWENAEAELVQTSSDGTRKFLIRMPDGERVEAVFMAYEYGNSLCISTQVGCKMGCRFCASTIAGYVRNLTPSEMLLEIYETERREGVTISGLVLMGIGEPLDNFDNVMRFLTLLSDPDGRGMSLRHVTLSTCGIVPRIRELAERRLGLTLAVSLHSPEDAHRSTIMPVNRRYPLAELMDACKAYFKATGRRVTFEYAVMEGENDSMTDARALAELLRGTGSHVNLIPVNKVRERSYHATRQAAMRFQQMLEKLGVNATVRRTLGSDIEHKGGEGY